MLRRKPLRRVRVSTVRVLEGQLEFETQFQFENGDGRPSRWNTLRALRVLDWYDRQP